MVTRALIDFIRDERSGKTSLDAIRSKLKEKGWKDEDINEGIQRAEGREAPTPPHSFWEAFLDLLALSWGLYRTKWKRFLGVGLIYIAAFLLATVFGTVLVYPHLVAAQLPGGEVSMELLLSTGGGVLVVAILLLAVIQLWFISTLYATALKTGVSAWERAKAGLTHLPAVIGIKLMMTILLLMCFIPPLLVGFFLQNPLVVVVFFPFSILAAAFLGFSISFALPAYFHGVAWTEAIRESIRKVWDNLLSVFVNCLLLVFGVALVTVLFHETGFLGALLATVVVAPIQVLFMLALYRTLPSSTRKT